MGLFGPKPDKYDDMSYEDMMSKYNKYKDSDPQQANYWLGHANRVGPGGSAPVVDTTGDWRVIETEDPYAAMMEQMGAAMEEQAAMQARYMEQASLLQQESLKQQEEAAKAARIESDKRPTDYAQANADDTARKQQLRRGLMSTFTRYGSGSGTKATKLGG